MCGIAGIINLNEKLVSRQDIEQMVSIVKYRGPDDEGYFIDNNIGLGHCRLSIIDLTSEGHQPMTNENGNLWIVHNGEIYNYVELADELKNKGHIFKSRTDTEVILHAYEEWGQGCLDRFNGMWAFVIWDRRKRQLFCSRDRFGIKPFYYYLDKDKFLFASEIKQLLALTKSGSLINDRMVYDYLFWGYENHTDETFFAGIKQLPGGHSLTLELSYAPPRSSIKKWYNPKKSTSGLKFTDCVNYLHHLLEDSVRLRLRSDVSVGSCLSGGIDSSSIVCLASNILKTQSARCQEVFTSCFKEKKIDETEYAHLVAQKSSCRENRIYPDIDTLISDLEDLIWHQEEPFGSLSIFSQWCIMKEAKNRNTKVLLDGQGADELFLGYERYYSYFLRELLLKQKLALFLKELFLIPGHSRLNLFQLFQYTLYFSYPRIRKHYLGNRVNKIVNPIFLENKSLYSSILTERLSFTNFDKLQKEELLYFQLPHLLRYEDKNSMAFSIETRLPFLDYRIVEFCSALPVEFKIRNGWTKYILRESMSQVIPREVRLRKRKIGFEVPNDSWLNQLKPKIISCIQEDESIEKYINKALFLSNVRKNRVNTLLLWRIYNLSLWMKAFKK